MTTIAYKDGVVAYDSRMTAHDMIISDNRDKKYEKDGVVFFIAGAECCNENIISAYFSRGYDENHTDISAFVYDDGKLFIASFDQDDIFYKYTLDQSECYTIGSGQRHAWTAMDMGASADKAVEMAMKRDVNTGGVVEWYRL